MSAPWQIVGIFCDDIRQEAQNRVSLMGIWPDNLNVSQIPGALPRLGIYVRCHLNVDAKIKSFGLTIRFPCGETEVFPSDFNEERIQQAQDNSKAKGAMHAGLLFSAVMMNVQIKTAGRFELIASVDGQEIVCGALNILLRPPATTSASAQPPSQSPSAS